MTELRISNILVNDDLSLTIAYASLLKDDKLNWNQYGKVPSSFKTDDNKKQSVLNLLFLRLYNDYHTFLEDNGNIEGTIDSWKEILDFLQSIGEDKTLVGILSPLYSNLGELSVELNPLVPGQLVATYASEDLLLSSKSLINPITGKLEIVYNFNVNYPTEY